MKPPLSRLPDLSIPGMESVQPTPPAPLVTVEVPRASGAIRVMLVDDHPTLLWGLVNLIESQQPRMEVVGTARTCAEALEKIGSLGADVILLDLDMGNMSSIDIIPLLLSRSRSNVLIFTGWQYKMIGRDIHVAADDHPFNLLFDAQHWSSSGEVKRRDRSPFRCQ